MKEPEFKTYLFSYFHNGFWWSLEISAESQDDAQARLQKLPLAKYDGELMAKIPAASGLGIWVRLVCWIRNWRKK